MLLRPSSSAVPVQVLIRGWCLEIAPAAKAAVSPTAHELTHVMQQRTSMRAWQITRATMSTAAKTPVHGWDFKSKPPVSGRMLPDVGDEVLVAFEHADPRAVTLYFDTSSTKLTRATAWKVELGVVARSAVRLIVRQRGAGQLAVAVRTSADSESRSIGGWTSIFPP